MGCCGSGWRGFSGAREAQLILEDVAAPARPPQRRNSIPLSTWAAPCEESGSKLAIQLVFPGENMKVCFCLCLFCKGFLGSFGGFLLFFLFFKESSVPKITVVSEKYSVGTSLY